jgi:hypothetical protein
MRSHGHEAADETWLTPLKRAMLLGLQHGSVKTLFKLSRIIGIHNHFVGADPGPNREQITMRRIGIALNSKYPLRALLANEGVDIPQPDPCDANTISIATASSYTDVVQALLSNNVDVQPQFLVESLFRGNTTDVYLIANRLCSGLDSQSQSRLDILDEILLCALHQQMVLHNRHWKRSDYLTTRSGEATDVDTFDLIWDTSVLDMQRSCLEWDFVDVILPRMTESDKHKAPRTTPSPNHIGEGPNVAAVKKSALGLQTLFLAVALRARELVQKLVQYEPLLVHEIDVKGRTGLMATVCTRSEDLTRLLLESLDQDSAASAINATSETGYSAIAYAVRARNVGQVLRLLEIPDFDVWSVFHEVVEGGYPFVWALDMIGDNTICDAICKSLLAHTNTEKLFQATQRLQRLPKRLYLGEDRHRGCDESWKPLLCYAVIYRRLETFKFLLEIGSDFERTDGHGRTALSHAEESMLACDESRSMVDILLARGADQLRLDHARRFPLWYALNSYPGRTAIYYKACEDVDHNPDGYFWEHEQLQKIYVDRPRFMSEAEAVGNALFDLAISQCASSVLELLVEISDGTLSLEYVGT